MEQLRREGGVRSNEGRTSQVGGDATVFGAVVMSGSSLNTCTLFRLFLGLRPAKLVGFLLLLVFLFVVFFLLITCESALSELSAL